MIEVFNNVIRQTLQTISHLATLYLPGLLAGAFIVALAYCVARLIRWILIRIFKGISFDRFLRQSGLTSMFDQAGKLRATDLVARSAYWIVLLGGILIGIDAFNTQLTSRITEATVVLFPKLIAAAAILLAGAWLGRYLRRGTLVWAVNEGIPWGRRLALAVHILIVFISVIVAADYLDFARRVFLAAFVILVGGLTLAGSLTLAFGGRELIRDYLRERRGKEQGKEGTTTWQHL
jgi:flagellar biosynthesis protein FliQ